MQPLPTMSFKDYVKFGQAYRNLSKEQAASLRLLARSVQLSAAEKAIAEGAINSLLLSFPYELAQDEWPNMLHALMGQQVALEEDRDE